MQALPGAAVSDARRENRMTQEERIRVRNRIRERLGEEVQWVSGRCMVGPRIPARRMKPLQPMKVEDHLSREGSKPDGRDALGGGVDSAEQVSIGNGFE
jgi:hypothetical protein